MVPLSLLRMWSPEDSRLPPGNTLPSCSTSKAGNSNLFLSYKYRYTNILVFSNKSTRICVTLFSVFFLWVFLGFFLHKPCKTGYLGAGLQWYQCRTSTAVQEHFDFCSKKKMRVHFWKDLERTSCFQAARLEIKERAALAKAPFPSTTAIYGTQELPSLES